MFPGLFIDWCSRLDHPWPEVEFLLIGVSDTTLDYDREEKLPAHGVLARSFESVEGNFGAAEGASTPARRVA
jgi:hypothetical protein